MNRPIKYKRITKRFQDAIAFERELQEFFDELILDGWEIINYVETNGPNYKYIEIIIVCKKMNYA